MRGAPLNPPSATPYLVAVVAGAMAFLGLCAIEAGQGAGRVAGLWGAEFQGRATVRVPADAGPVAAEAAAVALRVLDGVTAADVVPPEAARALLLPWIGDAEGFDDMPLPWLVDVSLADPPPARSVVQAQLDTAMPGAVYDDHASWRGPLERAAAAFGRLVTGSVALMAGALVAMVVVAARASLAGASATVRTLRLLGARDGFIAGTFDRAIGLRALIGGAVGAPMAAVALAALPTGDAAVGLGMEPATIAVNWPALLALPLACGAVAYVTARIAIFAMLRAMP